MINLVTILSLIMCSQVDIPTPALTGAWQSGPEDNRHVMIFTEEYFSVAHYDLSNKKFISTSGGSYVQGRNTITLTYEYNTAKPDLVNTDKVIEFRAEDQRLTLQAPDALPEEWKRIDDGTPGKLSGAWLITGREQRGEMTTITPGARKTMKILSGTRFQWIAYNTETKEFLGTGGGTYTTDADKYIENIEFFSRDNSRVGNKLSFDFAIEKDNWLHSGLSSKGDPIKEVWTKRTAIK